MQNFANPDLGLKQILGPNPTHQAIKTQPRGWISSVWLKLMVWMHTPNKKQLSKDSNCKTKAQNDHKVT